MKVPDGASMTSWHGFELVCADTGVDAPVAGIDVDAAVARGALGVNVLWIVRIRNMYISTMKAMNSNAASSLNANTAARLRVALRRPRLPLPCRMRSSVADNRR